MCEIIPKELIEEHHELKEVKDKIVAQISVAIMAKRER